MGTLGTIRAGNLACGPSTPWKRIRCSPGRGTSAAKRCMSSSGDITICVVPSRQGLFELQHDLACVITIEPLVGIRWASDVAAQTFELLALMGATAHRRMQTEAMRVDAA